MNFFLQVAFLSAASETQGALLKSVTGSPKSNISTTASGSSSPASWGSADPDVDVLAFMEGQDQAAEILIFERAALVRRKVRVAQALESMYGEVATAAEWRASRTRFMLSRMSDPGFMLSTVKDLALRDDVWAVGLAAAAGTLAAPLQAAVLTAKDEFLVPAADSVVDGLYGEETSAAAASLTEEAARERLAAFGTRLAAFGAVEDFRRRTLVEKEDLPRREKDVQFYLETPETPEAAGNGGLAKNATTFLSKLIGKTAEVGAHLLDVYQKNCSHEEAKFRARKAVYMASFSDLATTGQLERREVFLRIREQILNREEPSIADRLLGDLDLFPEADGNDVFPASREEKLLYPTTQNVMYEALAEYGTADKYEILALQSAQLALAEQVWEFYSRKLREMGAIQRITLGTGKADLAENFGSTLFTDSVVEKAGLEDGTGYAAGAGAIFETALKVFKLEANSRRHQSVEDDGNKNPAEDSLV